MSAQLELPRWAYVPGTRPEPDREPLERAKALVPAAFIGGVAPDQPAFRYGVALHDDGFFWEAHEVWETVWKAAPQNGCDRLILRAMIQLANAGLKLRMRRRPAALRVIQEGRSEFAEAARRQCYAEPSGLARALALHALLRDVSALSDTLVADRSDAPALVFARYLLS